MDYKIPVASPKEQIEVVNQIEILINKEEDYEKENYTFYNRCPDAHRL